MNYDFDNPHGLDQKECEWLADVCLTMRFKTVLEFGPGNSTLALFAGGATFIDSCEQDENRTDVQGLPANIIYYECQSWPLRIETRLPRYDLAFIDGPTGHSVSPARLNAALFAFSRADFIALHDARRDASTVAVLLDLGMRVLDVCVGSQRGLLLLARRAA